MDPSSGVTRKRFQLTAKRGARAPRVLVNCAFKVPTIAIIARDGALALARLPFHPALTTHPASLDCLPLPKPRHLGGPLDLHGASSIVTSWKVGPPERVHGCIWLALRQAHSPRPRFNSDNDVVCPPVKSHPRPRSVRGGTGAGWLGCRPHPLRWHRPLVHGLAWLEEVRTVALDIIVH